jgi:hypothetical protein
MPGLVQFKGETKEDLIKTTQKILRALICNRNFTSKKAYSAKILLYQFKKMIDKKGFNCYY